MMKYVFVLALLHLCVSAKSDTNLNKEIIKRLTKLKEKVTPISNATVSFPAGNTLHIPQKCLNVTIEELGNLLDNVNVHNKDKHYISELKGNLNDLGTHNNRTCYMKIGKDPGNAFVAYIKFFKKLNTRG